VANSIVQKKKKNRKKKRKEKVEQDKQTKPFLYHIKWKTNNNETNANEGTYACYLSI